MNAWLLWLYDADMKIQKKIHLTVLSILLIGGLVFYKFAAANVLHSLDIISDISKIKDGSFVMPVARVRHLVLGVPRGKSVSPDSTASIKITTDNGASIQWNCRLNELTQANWQTSRDLESYMLSWGKIDPNFGRQFDGLEAGGKCRLRIEVNPEIGYDSSLRLFYVDQ